MKGILIAVTLAGFVAMSSCENQALPTVEPQRGEELRVDVQYDADTAEIVAVQTSDDALFEELRQDPKWGVIIEDSLQWSGEIPAADDGGLRASFVINTGSFEPGLVGDGAQPRMGMAWYDGNWTTITRTETRTRFKLFCLCRVCERREVTRHYCTESGRTTLRSTVEGPWEEC